MEFDLCSERIRAIEAKKPKKFPTFWSNFVRTFALTSEHIIRGPDIAENLFKVLGSIPRSVGFSDDVMSWAAD